MKLSALLSDGMILQRNEKNQIWGTDLPETCIEVVFQGSCYQTAADQNGKWEILTEAAEAGGPYTIRINGSSVKIISNVYIGEVWLLGGQSNMELPVRRVREIYETEFARTEYLPIRYFRPPVKYEFTGPEEELEQGEWVSLRPDTVDECGAVGYFFAKNLYEEFGVPIGLVNTAVGGTPIEAWMGETYIRRYPEALKRLRLCQNKSYVQNMRNMNQVKDEAWDHQLDQRDIGLREGWERPDFDDVGWQDIELPRMFYDHPLEKTRGSIWLRREFEMTEHEESVTAEAGEKNRAGSSSQVWQLVLGTLVDADRVYLNGVLVGRTEYQYPPRRYLVSGDILRSGRNVLAVRLISTQNTAGFVPRKPYYLTYGEVRIHLGGTWRYRIGAELAAKPQAVFFQYEPAGVYNGMIHPLRNYTFKGICYYQGESNSAQPQEYGRKMQDLIRCWRETFKRELPFVYVQLPNFGGVYPDIEQETWPLLREEQKAGLVLESTGMAVSIDIGESVDLHPMTKQEVGRRLALQARKIAYGQDICADGPIPCEYRKLEWNHKAGVLVRFRLNGSKGLCAGRKNTQLHNFEAAGSDGIFSPASACFANGTGCLQGLKHKDAIYIWADSIRDIHMIRYAWTNDPRCINLFNLEGLPAAPFWIEISGSERKTFEFPNAADPAR